MPFQAKRSRSRPLRSPKSSEEKKSKECTDIQDFDNESINEDSTERQLFAFLYERDWLDNRKIPVTAFTTDLGKSKSNIIIFVPKLRLSIVFLISDNGPFGDHFYRLKLL